MDSRPVLLSKELRVSSPTHRDRAQHLQSVRVVIFHEDRALGDDGAEPDHPEDHAEGDRDPPDGTCVSDDDQTYKHECPDQQSKQQERHTRDVPHHRAPLAAGFGAEELDGLRTVQAQEAGEEGREGQGQDEEEPGYGQVKLDVVGGEAIVVERLDRRLHNLGECDGGAESSDAEDGFEEVVKVGSQSFTRVGWLRCIGWFRVGHGRFRRRTVGLGINMRSVQRRPIWKNGNRN